MQVYMTSRRAKRAVLAGLVAALILATVVAAVARIFSARALQRQLAIERGSFREAEPVAVTLERVTRTRERAFSARLLPWTEATVSAEVSARVLALHADVGTRVEEGAPLATLDATLARLGSEAAAERAAEAKRRLAEAEALLSERGIPESELLNLRSAARLARIEAETSAETLARHTLRAPFTGNVSIRNAEPGMLLTPGMAAFTLTDLSRLRVMFFVNEFERTAFSPGTRIEVRTPAAPNARFEATVHLAASTGTPGSGLFRIEAVLDNADRSLPGHVSATVNAAVTLYRDSLMLPTAAVRFEGSRASVTRLLADGSTERVPVEVGPELEGYYPVLSGLSEGNRILLR